MVQFFQSTSSHPMRNLDSGLLNRPRVAEESSVSEDWEDLDLDALSEEDLEDSEAEHSPEDEELSDLDGRHLLHNDRIVAETYRIRLSRTSLRSAGQGSEKSCSEKSFRYWRNNTKDWCKICKGR